MKNYVKVDIDEKFSEKDLNFVKLPKNTLKDD